MTTTFLVYCSSIQLITAWVEKILSGSFDFCSDEVLENMLVVLGATLTIVRHPYVFQGSIFLPGFFFDTGTQVQEKKKKKKSNDESRLIDLNTREWRKLPRTRSYSPTDKFSVQVNKLAYKAGKHLD